VKRRLYIAAVNNRYGSNVFLPLAAGLMWAYARRRPKIAEAYELCDMLYMKEPIDVALARLDRPDVLALSSYIWNWEWNKAFAKEVKQRWPRCAILVGGVQVPNASPRALDENPQFDFAIYGEGEEAFAQFLEDQLLDEPTNIVDSLIWRANDGTARVNPRAKPVELDEIPSPYLEGLFDHLVADKRWMWNALQETNRGCPYSSFGGETYVALPDRILRFDEESYSEDRALACPDLSHKHRLGELDDRAVSQGARDCFEISFSNGLSLVVTKTHPMFAVRNEQIVDAKANELKVGDWIPVEVGQNKISRTVSLPVPSKTEAELAALRGEGQGRRVPDNVNLPTRLNEDVAWLTGYLIGDGCLPSDDRASVLFAVTPSVQEKLAATVQTCFGLQLRVHGACNTKKMQHGAINSRKVVQFFRESLGMESGERKLKVPRALFRSPSKVVRAFLDGLWAADGHCPKHGEPYLCTVSEQLARECAVLIHWIGDAAVVRKVKQRGFTSTRSHSYRVEWHGDVCRKRVEGKPCVLSRVPVIRHTYRDRKGELRLRNTAKRAVREGSPREVLRHFEPQHQLLDDRFVFVRVVSIKSAGMHETYDVHHHPEHKVAANGVFVRQCTFCAWGDGAQTKLNRFSEQRILDEFEWFGWHGIEVLYNADANWGILKRDITLTDALVETKQRFGAPRRFRAAFAKNSNDVVFEISKKLSEADMLKATTLALQSMQDDTLGLIKRKNIRYEKLQQLSARYEAADIATYTELIIGLPGETYDSFADGIDALLSAGQHDGLSVYLCMLLENTEMATRAYRDAHGIKSAPMRALLYHGTLEPGVPEEIQETVVGTSAMPELDHDRAVLFAWFVQALHGFGLTQHLARMLQKHEQLRFRHFYEALYVCAVAREDLVLGREVARMREVWSAAKRGETWPTIEARFGDVMWPPEELLFLRIACDSERFYNELAEIFTDDPIGRVFVEEQRRIFIPPTLGSEAEYAREAVWYGRKGRGRALRLRSE